MAVSTSQYREEERQQLKEKRRKDIIKVAQELFIKKGLTETTMSDIAAGVKISRRTLYRYYKTKEELAFQIEIILFEDFYRFQDEIFNQLEGNGLEKIKEFFSQIADYIDDNSQIIRFSGEFDHYFRGDYPYSDLTNQFKGMISTNDELLVKLIIEGRKDGSIRDDIEPRITALTMNNVLLSITQRVIIRGDHLIEEQNVNPKEMVFQQLKLFMFSLENK
ncbi:TetR/AcrR family transcriptional regulator [Vallitalea okinawensis]|uniref:TetR/AcrR family transcriptional regulator n=1 Tax=Vallitalea okinawensis TaxID=2078660 RepID=UPI00130086C1|nr:TetR/AcrR family transcriptional regulator [Vallitalea okinawensis]